MILHVSYANKQMSISQARCSKSAMDHGAKKSISLGEKDLPEWFMEIAGNTIKSPRGAGYWVWKPFIIWSALKQMNPDDVLLYTDAGILVNSSLPRYLKSHKSDIIIFEDTHTHQHYCKGSVLDYFGLRERRDNQADAGMMFFRKTKTSLSLVSDWLRFCITPGFVDDSEGVSQNVGEYVEHRHDQAILTCLCLSGGIPFSRNVMKYTKSKTGPSSLVFLRHRKRNRDYS